MIEEYLYRCKETLKHALGLYPRKDTIHQADIRTHWSSSIAASLGCLSQRWSTVARQARNNLLWCRQMMLVGELTEQVGWNCGYEAKRATGWCSLSLGWGFKVTEELLGLETTGFPPHMHHWWTMQQEQGKAKRSRRVPGGEASFPLRCPFSALYWQKLNIVLTVKKCLKSPVHYHRTSTEGWIWSWEPINS